MQLVGPQKLAALGINIPYTQVNKRNSLLSAYCLLSTCLFPGFAPG